MLATYRMFPREWQWLLALLFDLDDTLIAYSVGGTRAWDRLCRKQAPP